MTGSRGSVYFLKSQKQIGHCTNVVLDRNLKARSKIEMLSEYARAWRTYEPGTEIYCEETIEAALKRARAIGQSSSFAHVLITGSLHLVSGALSILGAKGN